MNVKTFLIETLKLLEVAIPPPPKAHHGISYAKYGSDESGWDDRLALHVNKSGVFHCLFFDDEDFEKSPETLVGEIVAILQPAQTLSGNAPIASAERVLTHGSDDHGLDADRER